MPRVSKKDLEAQQAATPTDVAAAQPTPVAQPPATPQQPTPQPTPPAAPSSPPTEVKVPSPGDKTLDDDIIIAPSRVKRVLNRFIANRQIIARQEVLKARVSAVKVAAAALVAGKYSVEETEVDTTTQKSKKVKKEVPLTAEKKAEFEKTVADFATDKAAVEDELDALKAARLRFGGDIADSCAVVMDELVREFAIIAMTNVTSNKKAMVRVSSLHCDSANQLPCYQLFKDLPSWLSPPEDVAEEETEVATDDDVFDINKVSDTFSTYVGKLCGIVVKNTADFSHIRVSKQFRSYVSKLLVELCEKLYVQFHLETVRKEHIKTINKNTVLHALRSILYNGIRPQERLVYSKKEFPVKQADPAAPVQTELRTVVHKEVVFDCPVYDSLKALIDFHVTSGSKDAQEKQRSERGSPPARLAIAFTRSVAPKAVTAPKEAASPKAKATKVAEAAAAKTARKPARQPQFKDAVAAAAAQLLQQQAETNNTIVQLLSAQSAKKPAHKKPAAKKAATARKPRKTAEAEADNALANPDTTVTAQTN